MYDIREVVVRGLERELIDLKIRLANIEWQRGNREAKDNLKTLIRLKELEIEEASK